MKGKRSLTVARVCLNWRYIDALSFAFLAPFGLGVNPNALKQCHAKAQRRKGSQRKDWGTKCKLGLMLRWPQ